MPAVCGCQPEMLKVSKGKDISLVTMNGNYIKDFLCSVWIRCFPILHLHQILRGRCGGNTYFAIYWLIHLLVPGLPTKSACDFYGSGNITVYMCMLFVGRYDLSMPHLTCEGCQAAWDAGVTDLVENGYWPATINFSTVYETDLFSTFEELKMASPGLSLQAFLRGLDRRTARFGRVRANLFVHHYS